MTACMASTYYASLLFSACQETACPGTGVIWGKLIFRAGLGRQSFPSRRGGTGMTALQMTPVPVLSEQVGEGPGFAHGRARLRGSEIVPNPQPRVVCHAERL